MIRIGEEGQELPVEDTRGLTKSIGDAKMTRTYGEIILYYIHFICAYILRFWCTS